LCTRNNTHEKSSQELSKLVNDYLKKNYIMYGGLNIKGHPIYCDEKLEYTQIMIYMPKNKYTDYKILYKTTYCDKRE
jgi:hypothetical protein